MYVYVKLIHFAMQQKLTQHCKPTTLQQKLIKKKKSISLAAAPSRDYEGRDGRSGQTFEEPAAFAQVRGNGGSDFGVQVRSDI